MSSAKRRNRYRNQLRIERLDCRQVMAGDVGSPVAFDPSTPPDGVFSKVFQNQSMAEGMSNPDLVGFARALRAANVTLYGAGWSQATTDQLQLFEDGGQFLGLVEATNADRTINEVGTSAGIKSVPTWRFPDGTFATGVQSLATISQRSGVAIPTAQRATFAPVGNQTVAIGSPVLLPIDAYDPEGGTVVVSVVTSDPTLLEARVLSGNRSARFDLNGYGDMVFQILETEAPRPAKQFLDLATSDFYDDIIFHRVIDGFVIQGGDPLGNGTGGSSLGEFDDQYNTDLQHNRKGILSYAKTTDDTNDSQFFITADETRSLDFNHSIFGVLVEGDHVRSSINDLGNVNDRGTNGSDKPLTDVVINSVDVFNDKENSVIKLKAIGNRTGTTSVTITTRGSSGLTFSETITVQVIADSGLGSNSQPFLNDIAIPNSLPNNTSGSVQLTSVDVEGDQVRYSATLITNGVSGSLDPSTGLLSIIPNQGVVGKVLVDVVVQPATGVDGALQGQSDSQRLAFNFVPTIPTTLPAPAQVDLINASDSGVSNSDGITNLATLTFTVSGVRPGNRVSLFADKLEVGRGVAEGTTINISTNLLAALGEGSHAITAAQFSDTELSPFSADLEVIYDSTAPVSAMNIPSLVRVGEEIAADVSHRDEGRDLRYSLDVAPTGATIDPITGVITWMPTAAQLGRQSFSLGVTDAAGNSRRDPFEVLVVDASIVDFRLEARSLAGNVVTGIALDEEFLLSLYARDLRGAAIRSGVASAYADIAFDSNLAIPSNTNPVQFGEFFAAMPSGSLTNASIDDLGASASGVVPTNAAEVLVATIRMKAVNPGIATITTNFSNQANSKVSLFGVANAIDGSFINFGQLKLNVGNVKEYGDAPSRYPVTLEQDGARHLPGTLALGSTLTFEANGTPDATASSDAGDNGILALTTILSASVPTTASLSVTASAPGKLDGWIDFNNDGDWSDLGEQLFTSKAVAAGVNFLDFNVPAGLTSGNTGARFRLSTAGALAPTGEALDGEVEDYLLAITLGSTTTPVDIKVPAGTTSVVVPNDELIVKQESVTLFKAPVSSFGDLRLSGSSLDDILLLTIQGALENGRLSFDGGLGKDFVRLIGSGQTIDLTSTSISLQNLEGIDLQGAGDNRLVISIDAVEAASSASDTLQVRVDLGDSVSLGTGWAVQSPAIVDGQLVHVLTDPTSGGTARVEIRNERMFQNPMNRFDADRNGTIQALDALRIINELSRRGTGPVQLPTTTGEISRIYFDVSGDNSLSALDALRVINALSRINRGGTPEGEAADVASQPYATYVDLLPAANRDSAKVTQSPQQIWEQLNRHTVFSQKMAK